MEGLVDCLGGEDDEGEDVANQSETSNDGEEHTLHKEGESVQPRSGCWRKLIIETNYNLITFFSFKPQKM